MPTQSFERLQVKTPEHRFLHVLETDFQQPPRVAQALLEEAQACLLGTAQSLRPGQMRVILARRDAGHGRALRETATTEVVWTVDAGREDRQVGRDHGRIALRRVRIQRLLTEAVEHHQAGLCAPPSAGYLSADAGPSAWYRPRADSQSAHRGALVAGRNLRPNRFAYPSLSDFHPPLHPDVCARGLSTPPEFHA
jgi:hypothetical protein